MYNTPVVKKFDSDLLDFMMDIDIFSMAMKEVVEEWENSMLNFLTNSSMNRVAFIGQCACCYYMGVCSREVKSVWREIPVEIKNKANTEAKKHLDSWLERRY